jgi:hypothetical protein
MRPRPASGPDGRAQRDLAPARRRAHEQQIGDVGARDEQHEGDGRGQDQEHRPAAPDHDFLDPFDAEAAAVSQRVGEPGRVFRGRQFETRLRLLEGHAGLQTRRGLEEVALIDGVRIELEGNPELGRVPAELRQVELRPDDPDHDMRITTELERLADDRRVAAEPPYPETMAQHGDLRPVRQVLLGGERSSLEHLRAEEAEVVGADLAGAQLLGKRAAGVVDDIGAKRGCVLNDGGLLSPVRELGR